jgi:hypothetical protein
MSLRRILSQDSVAANQFDSVRHQPAVRKVEARIQLLLIIYLVADTIPRGVYFLPHAGQSASFTIDFLINLSLLHELRSEGIGVSFRLFAGLA